MKFILYVYENKQRQIYRNISTPPQKTTLFVLHIARAMPRAKKKVSNRFNF